MTMCIVDAFYGFRSAWHGSRAQLCARRRIHVKNAPDRIWIDIGAEPETWHDAGNPSVTARPSRVTDSSELSVRQPDLENVPNWFSHQASELVVS